MARWGGVRSSLSPRHQQSLIQIQPLRLMCGPTTPFSHLELWVRFGAARLFPTALSLPGPGRLGLAGGLFGRWDSGLGLNRTVVMS